MPTEPPFPKVTPELLSAGPAEWEATWVALWESIDPAIRAAGDWKQPWFDNPLHDGNPIFTAWSPTQRRGIRVIQYEDDSIGQLSRFDPTRTFGYTTYLDWFGDPSDPEQAPEGGAIRELVIACVLSDNSLRNALADMTRWIAKSMHGYSFCESVHAGNLSPWHLRRLTDQGMKLPGGIDTSSLCGRVKSPYGWDLNVPVSLTHPSACKECLRKLKGK